MVKTVQYADIYGYDVGEYFTRPITTTTTTTTTTTPIMIMIIIIIII